MDYVIKKSTYKIVESEKFWYVIMAPGRTYLTPRIWWFTTKEEAEMALLEMMLE